MNRTNYLGKVTQLRIMSGLLLLILYFVAVCPGFAAVDSPGVRWDQLTAEQQKILKPFQDRWDTLSPKRQLRLQQGVERWANLTPEERDRMRQRFERWEQLPPDKKEQLRERFKQFRMLSPEQRQALREKRRWFNSLPPERRHELQKRWKNMGLQKREKLRRQFGVDRSPIPQLPSPPRHPVRPGSHRSGR